ncbi:metal ABC transporter permease [Actinocorallia sp. API 0066]|uniref:metal ABC transporter permease n=1 Tax=Actinocorallia sp. API 0066 TaxID=2896846 RepID=UPI001E5B1EB8|nr:metal ABC transporter permease [Actinocorallia sp. API 0066]MCD0451117.1 metal ABC transporter permease [Actinocorallia sp. API 0066]
MQRALLAALLIGIAAPAVGTFIVQRRLSLLGDGIGHVALTGVALGLVTSTSPLLGAIVVAVLGAVVIELLRASGRTGGDVALALLFYGGLAGGVLVTNLAPGGSTSNLLSYLFGSISSVSERDLWVIGGLVAAVLAVLAVFGRELFLLCLDEEMARASGVRVRFLSILLAVVAALTIVVAMRVVGLLLVSALMVVPVAAAQQLTRGFKATAALAMAFGVLASLGGLTASYQWSVGEVNISPGPAIVVTALGLFLVSALLGPLTRRRAAHAIPGPLESGRKKAVKEAP